MAGPLVPNLPLRVLQHTVAARRSHGRLRVRTQGYCIPRGNITFSLAKEILFLQTETPFIEYNERMGVGQGVKGGCKE